MSDVAARTLRSPLLSRVPALSHAFETGLAASSGTPREDRRRCVAARLAPLGRVWFLKQVHGVVIAVPPWEATPAADAAIVREAGDLAIVETADCVPILLVDPRAHLAAAVHAGWRGSASGIARRAVEALVARGAERSRIMAALGPCVGVCCYEVGGELRDRFGAEAAPFFAVGRRGRPHLDLRAVNQHQLEASGVAPGRIDHVARCTACDPARLPSFRRDGRGCGRIASYIGWAGQGAQV